MNKKNKGENSWEFFFCLKKLEGKNDKKIMFYVFLMILCFFLSIQMTKAFNQIKLFVNLKLMSYVVKILYVKIYFCSIRRRSMLINTQLRFTPIASLSELVKER